MASVRQNLAGNLVGVGAVAAIQFGCIPVYLALLGIEAYGIITLYATLQLVFFAFDIGLSPAINRELARSAAQSDLADKTLDLMRTVELIYWAIGIAIGTSVILAAPWLSSSWIKDSSPADSEMNSILVLVGILLVANWPLRLYQSALNGLQKQVQWNVIRVTTTAFAYLGAIVAMMAAGPSLKVFFLWQIFAQLVQTALTATYLWRSLPSGIRKATFNFGSLRQIHLFAAGMAGITITSLILTQADKIVLSKLLDLADFGYYGLAAVIASGLFVVINPLFNAVWPRFSASVSQGDSEGLKRQFHLYSQLMSVLLIPAACVVSMRSFDLVFAWTGSTEVANHVSLAASILAAGTALNGIWNVPYALQLAKGYTVLPLRLHTYVLIVFLPGLMISTTQFGGVGAAAMWFLVNCAFILIGVPITCGKLLGGGTFRWYFHDTIPALVISVVVVKLADQLFGSTGSRMLILSQLILIAVIATMAALLVSPLIRNRVACFCLPTPIRSKDSRS
jgi:O-antigen/teichoic acid export membrane protein